MNKQINRDFKGIWIPKDIYLNADLSWTEKILIVEIDSLDNDDEKGCYASSAHFAEFLGLSEGSVRNMLVKLKQLGWIYVLWSDGRHRGLRLTNSTRKRHKNVTQKRHKKMTDVSQKYDTEVSQKHDAKNTEEEFLVIQEEKEEAKPRTRKPTKPVDPRTEHPAIVAIRDLVKLFPPAAIWDTLIDELGTPDLIRLKACNVEWLSRGYKPTNYAWARDWYLHGIPNTPGDLGRPLRVVHALSIVPDAADLVPPVVIERRPPDESLPEHRELWRTVREQIRSQVDERVFTSWFELLIFDGLNAERNAFKLRAGEFTVSWIKKNYSETLYEVLTSLGLGEFTFEWEIEGDELEVAIAA